MPQNFPSHKLSIYISQIRASNPDVQTILFCPNKWNTTILAPHLASLLKMSPSLVNGSITRLQVAHIGKIAVNNNTIQDWNSFFLAVMIWGYGMTGYGPYRTGLMLSTKNFSKIYRTIRCMIQNNQIQKAYDQAKIDRCGPPFFTKLFYFLGLIYKITPMPLILDSRVSNSLSLKKCGFANGIYFRQKAAARFGRGYYDYVQDMNYWSIQNHFRPDQLEFFLFCPPIAF